MQNNLEEYLNPKPEGDIDLIAEVRKLLVESGLTQNVITAYDTSRFIIEGQGKVSHVQRFLLNRFWNLQLSICKGSVEERYCLIPDGDIRDWLSLFKVKVLPFVIANGLPIAIPNV